MSDTLEFPIPGMTVMPCGMPLLAEAFVACGIAAVQMQGTVEAFQKESGLDLASFLKRSPIDRMIDQATGAGASVAAKWFDWVAVNVWGLEGEEMPDEI